MPRLCLALLLIAVPPFRAAPAQEVEASEVDGERRLVVEPLSLDLEVGETARLEVRLEDGEGNPLDERLTLYSRARRSVSVDSDGQVEALAAGDHVLVVRSRRHRGERLTVEVPVHVRPLPIAELELEAPEALYAGTAVELFVRAIDVRGDVQADAPVELATDRPGVADFDSHRRLRLNEPGAVRVTAASGDAVRTLELVVSENPVADLELELERGSARTGDVVHMTVTAVDRAGSPVPGVPVEVSVAARLDDELGPDASGQVQKGFRSPGDWRFVAEDPGLYTLVATCGSRASTASLRVDRREYGADLKLVGQGVVSDTHTSDLWVWEGADGRDYAVTGTWGGNGEAIFWDVTDPTEIERIATVVVDARTVNDVKVHPNGRLCIISREGASNRKNGIVLIDVEDPRDPKVLTTYDEGLTGGVHNLFITDTHCFALSAGRRYDIIDITDPDDLRTVGTYELTTPGHSIHDVWVEDGLAYSSNWADGVHVVDVGNGVKGGSPENPVYVADYAYPSGWNHAAFPYRSSTGRFYVIAGDEAFPYGLKIRDKPTYPRGWIHFIDFTDPENPVEVARYQVPEAGTHNMWVEDDTLYVAYYNGGVRVVDISGELMGDLYEQGREMAFFLTDEPEGHIANAPMVWGPQPHKGHLFFSDWNSGLWSAKFERETGE